MSGIIGPITAGRIAFALGTVGVGALIGGAVADHRDGDVAKGALIGGASALAGLALLYGGAAAWKHFTAARTGATAGATALGTTLGRTAAAPAAPTLANAATHAAPGLTNAATHAAPTLTHAATHAAPVAATAATTAAGGATPTFASSWRTWVGSLFQEASTAATLRPLPVTVPAIASTPLLPVATTSSGSTFLTAMTRFLPG
jgi:hypothetical protein